MIRLRRDDGFILPFCLAMAAVMAIIFMYASSQSERLIQKVARSQAVFYGNQLSVKFAQRLKWSYDAARADDLNPSLGLCASVPGATRVTIGSGAIPLCLVNNQLCVQHPQISSQPVCIYAGGATPTTIFAAHSPHPSTNSRYSNWAAVTSTLIPTASAQNLFVPAEPPAGSTSILLTVDPLVCAGGDCRAKCGAAPAGNADCLTFKFCPLVGSCSDPSQFVWQTVAFLR
jgi:hypothetical protein